MPLGPKDKKPTTSKEEQYKIVERFVKEITERKMAEKALLSEMRKFLTLVSNIPGIVYRVACDQYWTGIFLSDKIEEITGYPSSDFINNRVRTYDSVIHPEDRQLVKKTIFAAIEKKGSFSVEYRIIRKDGIIRWAYARGQGEYDSKGNVLWIDGVIFDITEQRQIEEELKKSERKYQTLAEVSPIGISRSNKQGDYIYINERWLDIAGFASKEQALGQGWISALHPEDRERISALWYKAAQKGILFRSEYRFMRPDGAVTWVISQSASEIGSKGKIIGYVGTITDITKRKKAEQELKDAYQRLKETQRQLIQSEKMSAVGQLASGIAHEIRNPLNIILGGVESLELDPGDKSELFRNSIERVKKSIGRANIIVTDLLRFSRASELKLESVNLCSIMDEVVSLVSNRAKLSSVDISKNYPKKDIQIKGDSNMLIQAFFNLCNNSIDAMPRGGELKLNIYLGRDIKKDDNNAIIEIIDTGIGISKDKLSKIFDPFFTTKEEGKGTGLGLTIVGLILERHKAITEVESEINKGAKFVIKLPIDKDT